jgi:hypothetical protein
MWVLVSPILTDEREAIPEEGNFGVRWLDTAFFFLLFSSGQEKH